MTDCSRIRFWATILVLAFFLAAAPQPGLTQTTRLVDDFRSTEGWRAIEADGVKLTVSRDRSPAGPCLRLDYDFVTGGGFCLIQKAFPLELPDNYEFSFLLRGEGRENNLEFKMLDESGDNVWWVIRRNFEWPSQWRRMTQKRRHFEFAWGPAGPVPFKRCAQLQFAISSAKGGKGSVWLSNLEFQELKTSATAVAPRVHASSQDSVEHAASQVLAQQGEGWRSAPDARDARLTLDLVAPQELGGLVIEWDQVRLPASFTATVACDGQVIRSGQPLPGTRSFVWLEEVQARTITLDLHTDQPGGLGVRRIEMLPPDDGASATAFLTAVAKRSLHGMWPRQLLGKQTFWTIVGTSGEHERGLISEIGALEVGARQFSLEPFVSDGRKTYAWADSHHTASLVTPSPPAAPAGAECKNPDGAAAPFPRGRGTLGKGYLPIPVVEREMDGLVLRVSAFEDGPRGQAVLHGHYTLENKRAVAVVGDMRLALRPVQVNPAWQFLSNPGGAARVDSVRLDGGDLLVNEQRRVSFQPRDGARTGCFDWRQGEAGLRLATGASGAWGGSAKDDQGLASGAIAWPFQLKPGESRSFYVSVPTGNGQGVLPATPEAFEQREAAAIASWSEQLERVRIRLPRSARRIEDTWRSQLAYILINRDGPALTPGARSYDRSWIRDGAMMCTALLATGHAQEARDFIEWYAPYQFADGKVPCVVDRRGPDPVPEHDSHGQLIYALATYWRYTGDKSFLEKHYSHVRKAVHYIEATRALRKTPEYAQATGLKRACYGLMPESISHEGYSAKAMHSYWDDLWTLRGLDDAVAIAAALGRKDDQRQFTAARDDFGKCLRDSIVLASKTLHLDFIPGCVELGDFDSTSTTVAFWPCDEANWLPAELLKNTFERYWSDFQKRKTAAWKDFTPYELRHVGVLVRLGQRERALEALEWYLGYQRPQGWNHWAEVVWRDPGTPKFIGDMPHTWIAADYLNAVRTMVVCEQDADRSLLLFAGIPAEWIDEGCSMEGLITRWGRVDVSLRRRNGVLEARVVSERVPEGGYVISLPASLRGQPIMVNGKRFTVAPKLRLRVVPKPRRQ